MQSILQLELLNCSITFLENVAKTMDRQCSVVPDTIAHHTQSSIRQVVKVVCKQKSLTVIPGQYHSNFKSLPTNPIRVKSLDWNKTDEEATDNRRQ